ncbi:MAG: hypothetical protein HY731_12060 [Candidatus Tectomicrobia bacterium]|nr:hypothetical protein [Candidatus Tectomicrobia bacterium]
MIFQYALIDCDPLKTLSIRTVRTTTGWTGIVNEIMGGRGVTFILMLIRTFEHLSNFAVFTIGYEMIERVIRLLGSIRILEHPQQLLRAWESCGLLW